MNFKEFLYSPDLIKIGILAFGAIGSYFFVCRLVCFIFKKLSAKTKNTWDDILIEQKVFERFSYIAPVLFVYAGVQEIWSIDNHQVLTRVLYSLIIFIGMWGAYGCLNAFLEIYKNFSVSKRFPLKGYIQLIKIFLFIICSVIVISSILDKSPIALLSGIGALTAVLMLVFKNSILSLVANIQIVSNKSIQVGDWVEMPEFGADGDVVEIALNTIKIQNWDKTYTVIPMHLLLEKSYKNWRGMQESGGRRIKRSIMIDLQTVKFLDENLFSSLSKIQLLKKYIQERSEEIKNFNLSNSVDDSSRVNGRRLTNLGSFRAYIEAYLKSNNNIHKEMTLLVRHLAPTEKGLPVEIYAFVNDTNWSKYEAIQADIFDHLLAAIHEFDLRVFQEPSGNDFQTFFMRNNV